jgi:hypothetical protein
LTDRRVPGWLLGHPQMDYRYIGLTTTIEEVCTHRYGVHTPYH